jgi:hypothetical protein
MNIKYYFKDLFEIYNDFFEVYNDFFEICTEFFEKINPNFCEEEDVEILS